MTDGHDDGHGAGIERERAHTHLSRRVNEHPDVGTVKQRASLDWKADGTPVQAHAGMLTQEGVKQRSPPRVREAPVEGDPQARHRPLPTDGYGHVKNASDGLGDVTELCDLVQHRGGPILDCARVQSGVEGRGKHDRSGLRIRVSQLTNEVCPGPVREPEIEDHHIGSSKHAARLAQRRYFSHDLKVGIGPELRSDRLANDRAVFHE
jgi:hypothetical protein